MIQFSYVALPETNAKAKRGCLDPLCLLSCSHLHRLQPLGEHLLLVLINLQCVEALGQRLRFALLHTHLGRSHSRRACGHHQFDSAALLEPSPARDHIEAHLPFHLPQRRPHPEDPHDLGPPDPVRPHHLDHRGLHPDRRVQARPDGVHHPAQARPDDVRPGDVVVRAAPVVPPRPAVDAGHVERA
ncbi:hypothetical protein U9M48_015413 [Paspalum notatum var. saurae]|uniref:Uncharacterized protein n=1 Tax=Paspalum notatum var. saurae TaxID=547442 RepID=A0AAQ3T332_PASNO